MAAVVFYEFCFDDLVIRSERTLNDLIKWIGRNRSLLEVGLYEVRSAGERVCRVFRDHHGSVVFYNDIG